MTHVVITGSTRGIGLGLASAFLAEGCRVTISGRRQDSVDEIVAELSGTHGAERVSGKACDIQRRTEIQQLWDFAAGQSPVDIWINNAGIAEPRDSFVDLPPSEIDHVVQTNLLGMMHATQIALKGMLEQGQGRIYNMEGMGSDGRHIAGMLIYGSTKRALRHFSQSLRKDLKEEPVHVGTLSPGMVVTDMLMASMNGEGGNSSYKIMNILADRTETVTPWLVKQILSNKSGGADIVWLTPAKIMYRFLMAPFQKRNVLEPPQN